MHVFWMSQNKIMIYILIKGPIYHKVLFQSSTFYLCSIIKKKKKTMFGWIFYMSNYCDFWSWYVFFNVVLNPTELDLKLRK